MNARERDLTVTGAWLAIIAGLIAVWAGILWLVARILRYVGVR